jgi:hypothetical protein
LRKALLLPTPSGTVRRSGTAKGEMVYSLDCKALKAENKEVNYKPDMPATNLPGTVIPESGKTQTPETTPTKAK